MGLHKDFPKSPYEILDPEIRWFPAQETLREKGYNKLLPPLVAILRKKIKEWRDSGYSGASETSKALLKYWFEEEHISQNSEGEDYRFRYYYCQREAVETVIYLHDVVNISNDENAKFDMMKFDSTGQVSSGMFSENWRRFVIKMATGSGKTKVLSLLVAWSFYHKLYEPESDMARNFLLITPNIIVLDRLKKDFDGLKIFFEDPIIPQDGYCGRNWKDDFQLTIHMQDDVNIVRKEGNIFLTNIHRVFESNNQAPSFEDEDTTNYFLGEKAVSSTNESKVDLGEIVREIDELMVLNDEAHHVHEPSLAWFKSIQDINNRLLQKGSCLSMQIDTTATPKHDDGAIFVQTITDYPLVEAIYQNIVKHPILPDQASRAKLAEKKSTKYSERYEDYLRLGYEEWKKASAEHEKLGKKAVMFVMTDDTINCDEVGGYLEARYPEFKDAVLVIHTNKSGEISESLTSKSKEELEKLRKSANEIDKYDSKYKAIISVLVLKEGWDVRNVTTIVGLRAFSSSSKILPEQTLGRGLRRMYGNQLAEEYVSIVGTEPFMDFVDSIKSEGVVIEQRHMGMGAKPIAPLVIEIDNKNMKKDLDKLDIEIPILTPRIYREFKNLSSLDVLKFRNEKVVIKEFNAEQKREIVFKYIITKDDKETSEIHHTTVLDTDAPIDFQSVIGFYTLGIMREMRLVSGYDILYEKVKDFIQKQLFEKEISIDDANILRNLSELEANRTIFETFKSEINKLTVVDKGEAEIREYIKLSKCRPFMADEQGFLMPKKSVFNKIIGDSHLELEFAAYLENCEDIISYGKNYFSFHFKLDYRNADGGISNYIPDFLVKKSEEEVYIIETKGLEDLDSPLKFERLKQWCTDINAKQNKIRYDCIFVEEEEFRRYHPSSFKELIQNFKKYKNE